MAEALLVGLWIVVLARVALAQRAKSGSKDRR